MRLRPDLHVIDIVAVYPKSIIYPLMRMGRCCLGPVCLYSSQRVTKRRYVVFKVMVRQPLPTPLDSKTSIVRRFRRGKVDYDEEAKRLENETLHRACPNIEHLYITNACIHTAAGMKVECLEYVDDMYVTVLSKLTHGGCCEKLS